jgi:hypothetical protein
MSDDWKDLFAQALKLIEDVEKTRGRSSGVSAAAQRSCSMTGIGKAGYPHLPEKCPAPAVFSPRKNGVAEGIPKDYEEDSRDIKLSMPEEKGEIDLVAAPYISDNPFSQTTLYGMSVKIETPEEISGKKVFYRTEDFMVRNVFDLVVFFIFTRTAFWQTRDSFHLTRTP